MNNSLIYSNQGKMAVRLESLLMILHKCHEYFAFCDQLSDLKCLLNRIRLGDEPREREWGAAAETAKAALSLLVSLGDVSPTVIDLIRDMAQFLSEISSGMNADYLLKCLEDIRRMVQRELESRFFLMIPSPRDKMLRNPEPFGSKVFQAFPSARQDLTDAASAFATELYTACVFHLMRAVEHGLVALALDRRIKTRTKSRQIYPFDLATWEVILRELDGEIGKIAQWPKNKGNVRTQAVEFYGAAVAEVRGFKDAWRNHVMHSRCAYNESDAIQVKSHVERFMVTLSSRISEQDRTPYVWTKRQLL